MKSAQGPKSKRWGKQQVIIVERKKKSTGTKGVLVGKRYCMDKVETNHRGGREGELMRRAKETLWRKVGGSISRR